MGGTRCFDGTAQLGVPTMASDISIHYQEPAKQYRHKQTICYVSVHNGTDTNLRRV